MIDKATTRVRPATAQGVWRWMKDAALEIDTTARALHRIQYDRPWERVADRREGRTGSSAVNCS